MSDTSKKEFKRSFSGYVEICEKMPTGMITVRGDLSSRKLKSAFSKVVGATLPKERKVTLAENSIAWMSPDELLIICGYDNVSDLMKKLQKDINIFDVNQLIVSSLEKLLARQCNALRLIR